MTWVFWGAALFIVYVYAGYPCWLWIRSHVHPQPVRRGNLLPSVSIVVVARNEERVIAEKLRNLLELNYPAGSYEVIVVSDGSSDRTAEVLNGFVASGRIRAIVKEEPRGKAAGLNDAIAGASGEVVVFNDARQYIEPDAIRFLVENFSDPDVGCASGELMLGDPRQGEATQGMGLYWRIEKNVRELESRSGSVVGATGALYAVRRNLLVPIPLETILDDVYIPMHVVKQGARVVFEPRACAWDIANLGAEREFARKVRTLSGNYQLLQLAPWLLSGSNPLRFEFVSHKLLRLLVPFALAAALISSLVLVHPFYRLALAAQLAFYALGLMAMAQWMKGPLARIADAALTFVVLNTAAAVAFANFVTGRKAAWNR